MLDACSEVSLEHSCNRCWLAGTTAKSQATALAGDQDAMPVRAGLSSSCMVQTSKFERLRIIKIDAQEWGLERLDRLRAWRGRALTTAPHLDTGLRGERAALFELRRRGVVVVARRWTNARARGDIDLIGWDGDCLCFIEVKTRTAHDKRPAESAVDEDKRTMVRRLAHIYLQTFPEAERLTIPVRFDVVSVYAIDGTTHFEFFPAAFGWQ